MQSMSLSLMHRRDVTCMIQNQERSTDLGHMRLATCFRGFNSNVSSPARAVPHPNYSEDSSGLKHTKWSLRHSNFHHKCNTVMHSELTGGYANCPSITRVRQRYACMQGVGLLTHQVLMLLRKPRQLGSGSRYRAYACKTRSPANDPNIHQGLIWRLTSWPMR